MNKQGQKLYRLDGIEVDPLRLCLNRDGEECHLRQKPFQVLIYLLENRQRLITKNELIDHVWRGTAVTENTLDQCLAEIRRALGDDSRHPRFIRTVPRTGYRFIGEVQEISADEVTTPESPTPETPSELAAAQARQTSGCCAAWNRNCWNAG